MNQYIPDHKTYHEKFTASRRPHILMITNHGVHEWQVVPGLPDTGGQNVFVNQFSRALADCGYRITIVNRGGYPHPVTGQLQRGLHYADPEQRIFYLEDGVAQFIRKEDMHAQIPALADNLDDFIKHENGTIQLIISHYWDAAELGAQFNDRQDEHIPHYWVPHSLGILKKGNVSREKWTELRIDERIETEIRLIAALDGIVATSSAIRQTLLDDYAYQGPDLFLPPCVDSDRYYPRQVHRDAPIWSFLAELTGLSREEVSSQTIITEISRTDTTKRKDVLIRAFARALDQHPDCLLVISIDDRRENQASRLKRLIQELDIEPRVAVVGSIWDILPDLYAVTDIYCTPSVMEGFGMSAQEAAASGVPVVSSDLVPFVEEYLLGNSPRVVQRGGKKDPLRLGEAAIVVPADDIEGFVQALRILLEDPSLRKQMGENAFRITVPYFTWSNRVELFMEQIESRKTISEKQHG